MINGKLNILSYDLNGDYAVNTMDLIDEIHYLLDDKKSEFHKFDSACLDFEGKPSVDEGPNEVIFKVHGTYGEMAGGYSFVHFPDKDSFVGNYFDDETITELPSFVNDYLEENITFEIINKELKVNIKE